MSSSGKSMNMAVSQVNVISSSVAVSQLVVGEVPFNKVILNSTLADADTNKQIANIVAAFNIHKSTEPVLTNSWIRGSRIPNGNFLVASRNNKPEITVGDGRQYAKVITLQPATEIKILGTYPFNTECISACGSHIINVAVGCYGKVRLGTSGSYHLLAQGPHVFHDPTLVYDGQVSQNSDRIDHGTIHVLRVPLAQYAKVWIANSPLLLHSKPNNESYVFDNAYFRCDGFVDINSTFIEHGNKRIIRVLNGKTAKVWVDNVPLLLEASKDAYEFNTPYFKLEPCRRNPALLFEDSTEKLIEHGSLKRVMPRTGEVAIVYDTGKLLVIEPSGDKKPTVIDSPTAVVDGFLSTGIQTLVFPSEETRNQRRKENSHALDDEVNYEVFPTKDSLKVGVKLLVAYKVVNPVKLLQVLTRDGVNNHVENLATVDMGKAIQQCSSQEFLCFYQTKPAAIKPTATTAENLSAPLLEHFQDVVKNDLSRDLSEYGIELVRLNFETPKVLDANIAKEMANQSLVTAQVNARESVLQQNFKIAQTEASQGAEVVRIKQEQDNQNVLTAARTQLEAAKLRADALVIEAEARKKVAELEGTQYASYPQLLQIKLAELQPEEMRAGLTAAMTSTYPNFVNQPRINGKA